MISICSRCATERTTSTRSVPTPNPTGSCSRGGKPAHLAGWVDLGQHRVLVRFVASCQALLDVGVLDPAGHREFLRQDGAAESATSAAVPQVRRPVRLAKLGTQQRHRCIKRTQPTIGRSGSLVRVARSAMSGGGGTHQPVRRLALQLDELVILEDAILSPVEQLCSTHIPRWANVGIVAGGSIATREGRGAAEPPPCRSAGVRSRCWRSKALFAVLKACRRQQANAWIARCGGEGAQLWLTCRSP